MCVYVTYFGKKERKNVKPRGSVVGKNREDQKPALCAACPDPAEAWALPTSGAPHGATLRAPRPHTLLNTQRPPTSEGAALANLPPQSALDPLLSKGRDLCLACRHHTHG